MVSILTWRSSRRAAGEANEAAKRSADAAERSARAAEETLADQRAAAAPKVRLVIEALGSDQYLLKNKGDLTATGVTLVEPRGTAVAGFSSSLTLHPDGSHAFMMANLWTQPTPGVVMVRWDGQSEPVPLAAPR